MGVYEDKPGLFLVVRCCSCVGVVHQYCLFANHQVFLDSRRMRKPIPKRGVPPASQEKEQDVVQSNRGLITNMISDSQMSL